MFREDLKGLPTGKIAPTARGTLAVNSPSEERGRARAEEASVPLIEHEHEVRERGPSGPPARRNRAEGAREFRRKKGERGASPGRERRESAH